MDEKLFKVTEHYGFSPDGKENFMLKTLKESELTKAHKDLFLGELLNRWDNSPKDTQIRFMQMLTDAVREQHNERFANVMMPIIDKMIDENGA